MATRGGGTSRLVPTLQVIGRSVFGRTVTHGTPSQLVSSWRPPESVITSPASATSPNISRYGSGSGGRTPSPPPPPPPRLRRAAPLRRVPAKRPRPPLAPPAGGDRAGPARPPRGRRGCRASPPRGRPPRWS